jgi:hypothetical protein
MSNTTANNFKSNMMTIGDYLKDMVEEGYNNDLTELNPKKFNIGLTIFKTKADPISLIEKFIENSYAHWGKIKEKNVEYFKKEALELFNTTKKGGAENLAPEGMSAITNEELEDFKDLFTLKYMDSGEEVEIFDEDRVESIWAIMTGSVKLSLKYVNEKRKTDEKFMPKVETIENGKLWNVTYL